MDTSKPAAVRRKLPAKYHTIVMPFILSLIMTCIVSFISTVKSIGLDPDLLQIWLGAWGLSWLVAFPVLLMVLPFVRKIVNALVESH